MTQAIGASRAAVRDDALDIAILAAGAGGMYCGSCLRDNALAGALNRAGHRATLVPMYTPLRTEDGSVAISDVYYGGVNVYLQHRSKIFRHTPRPLHWLLDRPGLLKLAGRFGAQTSPAQLGPLTLSVLAGGEGPAAAELRRLADFLKAGVRPQIVSLPNLMFIGLARRLREELGAAVVCELTGEDLFLGQLVEPYRSAARSAIRDRVADVTAFVATSAYYADEMARYLGIERAQIAVVHPGVPAEYVTAEIAQRADDRPPTIGYVARICPEKGFGQLVDAMALLRRMPGMAEARLLAGGYLSPADRDWFTDLMRRAESAGLGSVVTYAGELGREEKLELLDSVDVLSVPSTYAEAKGIYVLEALARGVPVVQPAHGSFTELIDLTAGGVLTPPGDLPALAEALADLLRDHNRRAKLGQAGRDAVRDGFTDDHMARKMLDVYRDVLHGEKASSMTPRADGSAVAPAGGELHVEGLYKSYPTPAEPLVVLRDVSIELRAGESLAIVGPSGSGKSTLLNILGTLDRPTEGRVTLAGVEPFALGANDLARFRAERIGFVFQDHHLLPQCTALENVLLPRLALGSVRGDDAERARHLLERVGLSNRAAHLPAELSGGERQRVAVARALMNAPLLILADEPTGNLDATAATAVGDLLASVAAEARAMLIVVTHSAELSRRFGRRMRMSDGQLVPDDA